MQRVLGRVSPQIYGVLRVVAGILFALHGAQKLFGLFGGQQVSLISQRGLAGVIEVVCGLLIALGLFTSIAAFLASGEMAAVYFTAHAPRATLPIENGGELAALYCFLFLYVASRGTVALGMKS
jgi:putative oxidoreductase